MANNLTVPLPRKKKENVFDLSSNNLEGSIPSELGFLTVLGKRDAQQLPRPIFLHSHVCVCCCCLCLRMTEESFSVANNNLVGSIPPELGNLTSLGKGSFCRLSLSLSCLEGSTE